MHVFGHDLRIPFLSRQTAASARGGAPDAATRRTAPVSVGSTDVFTAASSGSHAATRTAALAVTAAATRRTATRVAATVLTLGCALSLAACSGDKTAGTDAVSSGGSFTFVAPGGQTVINYPAADRKPVENISGDSLMSEGTTISLDDYKDQIVVLNAWGQWCAPCRTEVDDLETVQEHLQSLNAGTVLGINVRDFSRQPAQDFVKDNGVSYPSLYDPSFKTAISLGGFPASVIPTTIVLDKQHRPAAVFLRAITAQEVIDVIDQLQAEG